MAKTEWCWVAESQQSGAWFEGETYSLLDRSSEEMEQLIKLAERVIKESADNSADLSDLDLTN